MFLILTWRNLIERAFWFSLLFKDVINYAYTYASKTLNQELRDLIACTGDYSSRLNKTFMLEYKKTSGLKRQELLDKVENSKRFVPGEGYTPNKPNTKSKKSYDTNQIDVLIMNIKVKIRQFLFISFYSLTYQSNTTNGFYPILCFY